MQQSGKVTICGYRPGAIGRVTELHADFYSKNSGFGLFFEAKVAADMSAFLNRFNETMDGFWVAIVEDHIVGSIAIDGIKSKSEGAHLRWFIVDPEYQGQGIGNMLIREALAFCRSADFKKVFLWTFAGLDRARHVYETFGFTLAKEHSGTQWGVTVKEQMFELALGP
ncbi:MAG: GNAT family N-acetyltransferase [Deltaproteobacteria bacterium]|nr:GNAT family N-acetyltransferase [Deltaproteobacteria bacterium]